MADDDLETRLKELREAHRRRQEEFGRSGDPALLAQLRQGLTEIRALESQIRSADSGYGSGAMVDRPLR